MNIEERLKAELQNSINIQQEMKILINSLVTENNFLTETITANKLGKITIERKELQYQMHTVQNEANAKLQEAQKIQSENEQLLYRLQILKNELANKEDNIDDYIKAEAANQIEEKLEELNKTKEKCKQVLDKHIHDNNEKLAAQIALYKQKCRWCVIVIFVSMVIATISIYFNFA